MLDDFVIGILCTTTDDQDIAVAESRDGVLADIAEPNVADSAFAHAVDTLQGVGTDDDVLESRTILENKDSVLGTSIALTALHATVKFAVAEVLGRASLNGLDGSEDFHLASSLGDGKGLGGNEAGEESDGEVLHLGDWVGDLRSDGFVVVMDEGECE